MWCAFKMLLVSFMDWILKQRFVFGCAIIAGAIVYLAERTQSPRYDIINSHLGFCVKIDTLTGKIWTARFDELEGFVWTVPNVNNSTSAPIYNSASAPIYSAP